MEPHWARYDVRLTIDDAELRWLLDPLISGRGSDLAVAPVSA
ncbi:hypothetical protein [Streptomyces sp. NWU339]|nr:hypothetical protein [Streptomyces sp. NWU339]